MNLTELPTIQETTLYPILVNHLNGNGFNAIGETTTISGNRPDILFQYKGISFVIEVKIGSPSISASATAQAFKYARNLKTNNIIVLIFPEQIRKQTLLFSDLLNDLALKQKINVLILSEFWTESLECSSSELFTKLKQKLEKKEVIIDFNTVVKLINEYVRNLSQVVFNYVNENLIDEVVNKLDLFSSIGEIKDLKTAQNQVMNLASFLLFNQVLFYHIFTRKNKSHSLPELDEVNEPRDLQKYFDHITEIDYKAIYKVNILGHIPNYPDILKTINDIILAIKSLRAEHITHDLAGRFFHDLIPFEVRKVLAAFYTHPNAADLLASLCIQSSEDKVIDPACGSGTLLVSSYKRKENLYKQMYGFTNHSGMHKKFIEQDITGIDLMPFAAHISTINLTMQNIEQTTNEVRLATRDSLDLARTLGGSVFSGSIDIQSYNEVIQGDLFKLQLFEQKKIIEGALSPEGKGEGFQLQLSDVCIMNPPFTDREKMPKYMLDKLNSNFRLNIHCGNLINLWGYFLVLGDLLLKENGILGAVIPINIARGKASEKVRNFFLENHTLKYLIKPIKDIAFSEGSILKDILFITEKTKPSNNEEIKVVYLKKSIKELKEEDVVKFTALIKQNQNLISSDLDIFSITYADLIKNKNNMMRFLWASSYESYKIINEFYQTINKTKIKKFPKNFVKDCFNSAGFKGLIDATFITNPMNDKNRIERALMVYAEEEHKGNLLVRIKNTSNVLHVPKRITKKALRTLTGVKTMAIADVHDFWISSEFNDFKKLSMFSSKLKGYENFNWKEVKKRSNDKFVHLVTAIKFDITSPNTSFLSFYSEDEFIQADVFKIFHNVEKDEAKILCLFFNSIVGLLQFITHRQLTLAGGLCAIRETDLLDFFLIDHAKLKAKEKTFLFEVFNKLKFENFPSIIEQLENKFDGRIELDKAILQVMGYTKGEINKYLPSLYEVVLKELKK
jgi:hypothetical protein